jgi:uncharacterized membrane protein
VVGLGLLRLSLRFVDGNKGEIVDLFSTFALIPGYLVACIVVGAIVMIGLVFLIVPGIYLGVRFYMFPWVIVDKGVGPFEAMRRSWAMTNGSVWNLFLLGILLAGVNILGVVAILIGLLVTIPLSVVAVGYVYRRLEEAAAG